MKIGLFSRLKSVDRYESTEFKAGGYKWKLVVFPNGNKKLGVDDHISLYLEMCGDKGIDPRHIVTINYKFFLLNRQRKNYLVVEHANKKAKKYCIHQTIIGGLAGFDRFIPLEDFSNASNGYLIDDTCEIGVEVYVSKMKREGAGQLRKFVNLKTVAYKHVWMVPNFSKLYAGFTQKNKSKTEFLCSKPFTAGDQKYCIWRLMLYPKGLDSAKGSGYVSLFLQLFEPNTHLPTRSKVLAEVTIRILDQIHGKHYYCQGEDWFSDPNWNYSSLHFISQEDIAGLLRMIVA
ncbi:hypothetical protein M0R45_007368 [Rubus argutus]|uniref:MATH domain-containing protein n=2 Tax=Rubus argutus TaxID=59490 RepID=A0AAW1Y0I0_RUBAR